MEIKEIEKVLIEIGLEIAREGKGCLFVIKEKSINYEVLIEQDIKYFNVVINENKRRLKLLALHDGACIIDLEGNLIAYGAQIANTQVFHGWGTRHSASYTASLQGNTVIMSSEQDRKVKIFKDGNLILQIDSLEKDVEKRISEISRILESIGIGTLGVVGATSMGVVGIALLPGVIVFGASYYILNKFFGKERNLT